MITAICWGMLCLSCGQSPSANTNSAEQQVQEVQLIAPSFNPDSAYEFVQQQVNFGPRIPGTKAHEKCAEFLQRRLKKWGASVQVQQTKVHTHDDKTYTLKNIIASYQPKNPKRILITAHWDARPWSDQDMKKAPFDAANDGGSGVGIILEMARNIQKKQPKVGIDFILWDLEDYGKVQDTEPNEPTWCLGSQYWAKHPHTKNYTAQYAINLDMVGGINAQFTQDEVSRTYAPEIVQKVWSIGQELGYSSYFPNQTSGAIIDDHFWINKLGIPCVDIIHFSNEAGFYQYWHTQQDNMQGIDKNTLKAVGQTVLETIFREQ